LHLDIMSAVGYPSVAPEIRRIRADEGLKLRALRLRALADAPMAFGSTLAREEAFPESVWHERAEGGARGGARITLVAEHDRRWMGIVTGLARDPDDADDLRPVLVGMFVAPEARQRGVGRALVEAVVAWARARRAPALALWVTSVNAPALALYAACGFRRTGETKPLAHTPSVSEWRMVLDLLS
jgi:GNAT superfamily N-acetyltransferase